MGGLGGARPEGTVFHCDTKTYNHSLCAWTICDAGCPYSFLHWSSLPAEPGGSRIVPAIHARRSPGRGERSGKQRRRGSSSRLRCPASPRSACGGSGRARPAGSMAGPIATAERLRAARSGRSDQAVGQRHYPVTADGRPGEPTFSPGPVAQTRCGRAAPSW